MTENAVLKSLRHRRNNRRCTRKYWILTSCLVSYVHFIGHACQTVSFSWTSLYVFWQDTREILRCLLYGSCNQLFGLFNVYRHGVCLCYYYSWITCCCHVLWELHNESSSALSGSYAAAMYVQQRWVFLALIAHVSILLHGTTLLRILC